jgi:hypothetical protein
MVPIPKYITKMVPILRHFPLWHDTGTIFAVYLRIGTMPQKFNSDVTIRIEFDSLDCFYSMSATKGLDSTARRGVLGRRYSSLIA